jgi:hypothetical protein
MKQKIAAFMMGLGLLVGSFGLVSAAGSSSSTSSTPPMGFGLNESYSSGISGVANTGHK